MDDWIDPYGPAMWIQARITTDLDDDHLFDWVRTIVDPLGGLIEEAGRVDALAGFSALKATAPGGCAR